MEEDEIVRGERRQEGGRAAESLHTKLILKKIQGPNQG